MAVGYTRALGRARGGEECRPLLPLGGVGSVGGDRPLTLLRAACGGIFPASPHWAPALAVCVLGLQSACAQEKAAPQIGLRIGGQTRIAECFSFSSGVSA